MDIFNFPAISEATGKEIALLSDMEKIELAEYYMLHFMGGTTVSPPLEHYVCNGTYTRVIHLPKGMMLTGKVHNYDHTSQLLQGEVTIMTPAGIEHRQAPCTWVSPAGTKRLIYVHEDTIWATIHRSEKTEVSDLEKELVHESDLSWVAGLLPGGTA